MPVKKKPSKAVSIGLRVAAAAIAVAGLAYAWLPKVTVVPPTCLEKGYSIYVRGGRTQMKDIVDATGHDFSQWEVLREPEGVDGGQRVRTCQTCGYEEQEVFHEDGALPRLYLTGSLDGISKQSRVLLEAKLTMDDFNFEVVVYCTPSKSLTIPKNDAVKIDSNNYVVLIDTRIVGAGDLKCKVSAFIDDPDFPDGYRTEIVVIDTGIKISNPL